LRYQPFLSNLSLNGKGIVYENRQRTDPGIAGRNRRSVDDERIDYPFEVASIEGEAKLTPEYLRRLAGKSEDEPV